LPHSGAECFTLTWPELISQHNTFLFVRFCLLTMAGKFKEGCYTSFKDQKYADFLVECGFPQELAQELVGTHWQTDIRYNKDNGKWTWVDTVVEKPEWNKIGCWKEGVWNEDDHPLMGGKYKIRFCSTGESSLSGAMESAAFNSEFKQSWCEEGMNIESTINGKVLCEFWPRKEIKCGSYICVKEENLAGYMEAQGLPTIDVGNFKVCFKGCDSGFVLKEDFGILEIGVITSKAKWDEEFVSAVPGWPAKTMVASKAGVNKLKIVAKSPDGRIEEWDICFDEENMVYSGVDKRTGQTCKMIFKKYVDITGKLKFLTGVGIEDFCIALGVPAADVQCLMKDFSLTVTTTEKDGIYTVVRGGSMPHTAIFRLNKECEDTDPFTKLTSKFLVTLEGNTLVSVAENAKGTMIAKMIFGETFAVQSICLVGTNIKAKMIYQKIC
jgi:hypothetical protein